MWRIFKFISVVNTYDIIDIFSNNLSIFLCCLEVGKKGIRSETDSVADPEPVLLNVYGAPALIPRNEFRQPM